MRIVLDTNILVRANAKARGPARELLQLIVGSPDHVLLLHHPELRCELLGAENEEGVHPLTRNEPRDLHSGVRSGATV